MTETDVDPLDAVRASIPASGGPERMLPADAYLSPAVLAWEQRALFAGGWTCLGRVSDLFPAGSAAGASPAIRSGRRRARPAGA